MPRPVRIANCSGFYGDRLAAAREMLNGPVDVLTGDYLAELTMLILWKARQKDPGLGYATPQSYQTQLQPQLQLIPVLTPQGWVGYVIATLVQPANGESVLDSLPVSPDFNVIITARPPGSIPTSLQAGSYIIYMEQP